MSSPLLSPLLDRFHAQTPIRAGSLIVTVFGDAVLPRGGQLSLATLTQIMRAFRVTEGLVRTALSRLVADGWFERAKLGRNSFYRLTGLGHATFAAAAERIYAEPPADWGGGFDLVLLDGGEERSQRRAELEAAGYGVLGPGLLVSIGATPSAPGGGQLRLSARADDLDTARRLAARAWPIGALEARYRDLAELYGPAAEASLDGLDALALRILLVHDYRRILLKDPLLPGALLPQPWAGDLVRALCARIYRRASPAAERWLDRYATAEAGPLPAPEASFARRFRNEVLQET